MNYTYILKCADGTLYCCLLYTSSAVRAMREMGASAPFTMKYPPSAAARIKNGSTMEKRVKIFRCV